MEYQGTKGKLMATYFDTPSRTFGEYLLIPALTTRDCTPDKVSLATPLTRYKIGKKPELTANIPLVSAGMQAVSGTNMAIALAREGGFCFIYGSQSIQAQAEMIRTVKNNRAGFVTSKWNLKPADTLQDILDIKAETDHSTIPITSDGSPHGKLLGIITSKDYRASRDDPKTPVEKLMTPISKLITDQAGISLKAANDKIWDHKINCLPILDKKGNLNSLVFRKDYDQSKTNPLSLLDDQKRYLVGASINSHDYTERIPALVEAGADLLCIDSSDGYSVWQKETIEFVRKKYKGKVKIGAGNVVDAEAFNYLADAGADFIKIGIGGGSICITREQKGIGRGQASAVIEVAKARDAYAKKTGEYIPICSDGGIVHDYHVTLALAMGADFVMMGRYFARFDESPSAKVKRGNDFFKEYWGEGSNRARNWQRYQMGEGKNSLSFAEGVDSYIPYAGPLKDNLAVTIAKVKSTMSNCGVASIPEFHKKAKLTLVSDLSLVEGAPHDLIVRD